MPRIPFLQPTLRVTSTRRNITFGDRPPSAVGKPAIARLLGSPSGSRRFRRTEGDAGPPRGHPASNGRALDGVLPASGRSTVTFMLGGMGRGESVAAFSAGGGSVGSNPLTSLAAAGGRSPKQPFSQSREPVPTGARQCARRSGARDAFHRRRPRGRSCESPAWSAAPVGQRGRPPRVFTDVREHRLDLSSLAFACEVEAARAPSASADQCLHEHDSGPLEHPSRRICGWGDCPASIESPRSRAITEWVRGQGPRKTDPRRSPRRLLAAETSPQPRPARAPPVAAIALSPCPE